jgi:hypothetical protein
MARRCRKGEVSEREAQGGGAENALLGGPSPDPPATALDPRRGRRKAPSRRRPWSSGSRRRAGDGGGRARQPGRRSPHGAPAKGVRGGIRHGWGRPSGAHHRPGSAGEALVTRSKTGVRRAGQALRALCAWRVGRERTRASDKFSSSVCLSPR